MSIQVKDATGTTQTVNTLPAVGQAASAASLPVVIASDQSLVNVASQLSPTITNPTSTFTLPATTTAYAGSQLVANSATAGSVVVPSFSIANSGGGASIPRVRISTNDPTSTGWGQVGVQVDMWTAAPTFTNGDRGAFAVATGSAGHLGSFTGTFAAIAGDGTYAELVPASGGAVNVKLASGSSIYWTLQTLGATGVTGVSKTMILTPEILN